MVKPIGYPVKTTDDVYNAPAKYDNIYLANHGMLKVEGDTVTNDYVVKDSGAKPTGLDVFKLTTDSKATLVASGADATFTVVAAGGTAPYTYQWYWAGEDGVGVKINAVDGGTPFNATAITASLVNTAVTEDSAGFYWCEVKDKNHKSILSTPAYLTVT